MSDLNEKVVLIFNGITGTGRAIALKAAQDGAKIVIFDEYDVENKFAGDNESFADILDNAGASSVSYCKYDPSDLNKLRKEIDSCGDYFGKIDALVFSAEDMYLSNTQDLDEDSFEKMYSSTLRAFTFSCKYAVKHLAKSDSGHILCISPQIHMKTKFFLKHSAYTTCMYAMSMMVTGLAAEYAKYSVAVNSLWPTAILNTLQYRNIYGEVGMRYARSVDIMADAAHYILNQPSIYTGKYCLDALIVAKNGKILSDYMVHSTEEHPKVNMYIDEDKINNKIKQIIEE